MSAARPLIRSAVVIGGGVGGLASALALRAAGIKVDVFEQADDLVKAQAGGGLHLWTNAVRALHRLGCGDAAVASGSVEERVVFTTSGGRPIAEWDIGPIGESLGSPSIGIARGDLHQVLLDALGADGPHLGRRCVGFEQDGDGVTAHFQDGSSATGDLLVSADGLRSVVRSQLLGQRKPRYAGYTAWQGVVDFDHPDAPPGVFRLQFGRGVRFLHYHVGGGRVYWIAIADAPVGTPRSRGVEYERLRHMFGGWESPTAEMIDAADPEAVNRLDVFDRPPTTGWTSGRVVLLGDAAHAMTFNVGQGACQAIEDAVALVDQLASAPDLSAALAGYEARRSKRTAAMIRRARVLGAIGQWANPVLSSFRDRALLPVVLSTIGIRQQRADMTYQP